MIINQKASVENGLNLTQAHILNYLCGCAEWSEKEVIDGVDYHWVARQKIIEQMPILVLKPDTVYRHLKKLNDLGLISYVKKGKKDCVKVTNSGLNHYVGNESESNSDLNPTYKVISINKKPKDNIADKKELKKTIIEIPDWMPENKWIEYVEDRKKNKKHPMGTGALGYVLAAIEKTKDAGWPVETILNEMTGNGWRSVKAEWMANKLGGTNSTDRHNNFQEKDYNDIPEGINQEFPA